jgi:class 3 adenylate cyclase
MLPDRTTGSALFADISGFTVLTESLRKALGARQGAEALSRQMEEVFSALVAEVEMYGGSVINFAGDSMLCWFDRGIHEIQASSSSALSAAMGMQNVMQTFSNLALKVSIASGNSRRFVVGDETIQRLDVWLERQFRVLLLGNITTKGDIVVDEATVKLLGDSSLIKEWREEGGERFALVENASTSSEQPSAQRGDAAALLTDYPSFAHLFIMQSINGKYQGKAHFSPNFARAWRCSSGSAG